MGRLPFPATNPSPTVRIILTALAEGEGTLKHYCRGEDCLNTMRALQALGVRIDETHDELHVHGKGLWGLTEPE